MLNYASMSDKRKATRKIVPGQNSVYLFYRGKKICNGNVKNISQRGAFVTVSSMPVPLGAVVQMVFIATGGNVHKMIRKTAVITRVAEDGFGAGFIQSRKRTPNLWVDN